MATEDLFLTCKTAHVRIGLCTTGPKAYWPQFAGLRERLEGHVQSIAVELLATEGTKCPDLVLPAEREIGREAGECFCPVPEIANAFNRAGIKLRVVSGLLGLRETPAISMAGEAAADRPEVVRAWREIRE